MEKKRERQTDTGGVGKRNQNVFFSQHKWEQYKKRNLVAEKGREINECKWVLCLLSRFVYVWVCRKERKKMLKSESVLKLFDL